MLYSVSSTEICAQKDQEQEQEHANRQGKVVQADVAQKSKTSAVTLLDEDTICMNDR